MQDEFGQLQVLTEKQHSVLGFWQERKTVQVNQVFKIRRCYFQITAITENGITAKGISRKEYYDWQRGRPDWF